MHPVEQPHNFWKDIEQRKHYLMRPSCVLKGVSKQRKTMYLVMETLQQSAWRV